MASTSASPCLPKELQELAASHNLAPDSSEFAELLDSKDPLAPLRSHYHIPLRVAAESQSWPQGKTAPRPSEGEPALYLCGNSLGPVPKRTHQLIQEELNAWSTHGVLGHFNHPHGKDRQWVSMEERTNALLSDIVGCKPSECAAMGTLTSNIHLLFQTFYRPLAVPQGLFKGKTADSGKTKHKIIFEKSPFPSDQYALTTITQLNNLDPATSLVPLIPRQGERTLRTEDILQTMEREAATGECWGIWLGCVQYLTGQLFDLERIAKKGQELGIMVGIDLAHAFANVPLALHDWGIDFAAWCTYKYGSSGPGGIGGLFVHEKWAGEGSQHTLIRPGGWWGHNRSTRFAMPAQFDPMAGAAGFQLSNVSFFDIYGLRGGLETLSNVLSLTQNPSAAEHGSDSWVSTRDSSSSIGYGTIMPILRARSLKLTGYLEHLLFEDGSFTPLLNKAGITLITPHNPAERGSQLSICVPNSPSLASTSNTTTTTDAPGPTSTTSATTSTPSSSSVPPVSSGTRTLVSRLQSHAEEKHGLIVDIRNPDVIRISPVAMYTTFSEVWRTARAFKESLEVVLLGQCVSE